MKTKSDRRDWEDLSALDPYWAVLSDPSQRFGRWPRDEFLASGVRTVEAVLQEGRHFERPSGHRAALDFGCGVGRLTSALAAHFDHCVGLDISARMIEQARSLTAGLENCAFEIRDQPDLAHLRSDTFDMVLSFIVLQHIPSADVKRRLIAEFVRVLRPWGLLAFQLPSWIPRRHRVQPRPRLYGLLRGVGVSAETLYGRLRLNPMRMTFLPKHQAVAVIEAAGGKVLNVTESGSPGGALSAEYLVTKDGHN